MLLRFGSGLLLLCTLLVSPVPADTHPAVDSHHEGTVPHGIESSVFSDIDGIWLYVVRAGRIEKQFVHADKMRAPFIEVAGYINGFELASRAPLSVSVDDRLLTPVDADHETPNAPVPAIIDAGALLRPPIDRSSQRAFTGRYTSFPAVPGDALCKAREFPIIIDRNGNRQSLTVRQTAPALLQIEGCPAGENQVPQFYYLGDARERLQSRNMFKKRLQAVQAGIQAVEQATGQPYLVTRVYLIDYDGPHNAYTCKDRNDIWFYTQTLRSESIAELSVMAEHETLHILSDRLGLGSRPKMHELFNRLKRSQGHGPQLTTASGTAEAVGGTGEPKPWNIFDFINETNYFRGMHGGHAQDNLDEFCASFLHTLIYIDRLDEMRSRPIQMGDGSLVTLSHHGQQQLLADYLEVLNVVVSELPASFTNPKDVLARCQADPKFYRAASTGNTHHR